MRTVEMLKHGRRESHCGREGVGGHNETGLGYTPRTAWPECGCALCTFCVRSYPLQAVSICAYICVLIASVGFPPAPLNNKPGQTVPQKLLRI